MMEPHVLHDNGGSQPLRKQGYVSKDPTAPTAVLLQGSRAPPTATTPHEQGSNTSPLDTLAHCYTPRCTPGPSPYVYKRKVQGSHTRKVAARENGQPNAPPLSPSRRLVTPYYKRIHPGRRTTRGRGFPLAVCPPLCVSVSRRPIWAGTRSDNLLVGPGTPRGRNADT
jgi:hypothetical protein